uniref:Dicarboxylate transporter 1, chloroplastic n=1 Tax=Ananas comosus var. bracteatus TaxID=296719 RepID=A0A6V7P818_ANACO|nr:unnamed protein product [Ananas comosus var. bracteatus]
MESFALARPLTSSIPRPVPLLRRSPPSAARAAAAAGGGLRRPSDTTLRHRHRPLPLLRPRSPTPAPLRAAAAASSPPPQSPDPQSAPPPLPPAAPPPQGAKPLPLAISLAVGLAVRFLVPKPPEVSLQAWQLLAIFLSTIAGLVLSPLPVGAWAFLGLTTAVLTRTLSFATAFGAFTNEVIWLIVISFFFARGFVKTGLGDRIATYFVKWLGRSTLGLSYGLTISEACIAPAMPSTTARAGGVFLPIIKSLSLSAGAGLVIPRRGSSDLI